ncbi:serine/threonine protein phosphatase [Polaribacter sejongensis]|uniref:Metallophosphoesterase family protein n=1 Tax=Polaribacter sejongensis TaxID=985043 RepID=A0AAJ1QXM6_9FLAO|nr:MULTISPECIES: metallophosphoesterase family protein [Polaribacter]AUC20865.1 serine/threonine protein phosphatase [Polaribacter sejongensis]MDN3619803.1 metallophosphoesterase family protein [Polaribacter undariae]UWD31567.1 serine/threonine protein phosphatase [Polaribacter undariae]
MRTFAIGDIHGGLKALIQVLNKLELKDGDRIIFMGDYVDGWSESAQVVALLLELSQKFDCVFIKGNHDVWCQNWLKDANDVNPIWFLHGGKETMESYEGFSVEEKKQHLTFFENLPLYHIDTENRLFLHAGFTSLHGVEKEQFKELFYLDRSLWEMLLALDSRIEKDSLFYPKRIQHYKEIYIGHTPTTNYNEPNPINIANVWNVDTGAAFRGKVTGLNIYTKEFVQSDSLPSLYPNETGRNK